MGDFQEFVLPEGTESPLPDKQYSFSFAGCGFLGVYHIGVLSCLRKYVPHLLKDAKICGASAGALLACCEICQIPSNQCIDLALKLVSQAHKHALGALDPDFVIDKVLRSIMEKTLPENAHKLCSGRLFVSVSKLKGIIPGVNFALENEVISNFPSRKHLIDTLLCSSFIPVFSSTDNPILNEEIAMDGGFSDNLPRVDENTILVCPLAGDSHISPLHRNSTDGPSEGCILTESSAVGKGSTAKGPAIGKVNAVNTVMNASLDNVFRFFNGFFPPGANKLVQFCWEGFRDAYRYLVKNNMIRCRRHQVFTYISHRHHSIHEDCSDCAQHIQHGHQNNIPEEDAYFKACIKRMGIKGESDSTKPLGYLELMKLVTNAPREMCRLLFSTWRFGLTAVSGAYQLTKFTMEGGPIKLIADFISALNDKEKMTHMFLTRSSLLYIMKFLELCLRVGGYALTTRVWEIAESYYWNAVEANKAKMAQAKQERLRRKAGSSNTEASESVVAEVSVEDVLPAEGQGVFAMVYSECEEDHQAWLEAHEEYNEVLTVHYRDSAGQLHVEALLERHLGALVDQAASDELFSQDDEHLPCDEEEMQVVEQYGSTASLAARLSQMG